VKNCGGEQANNFACVRDSKRFFHIFEKLALRKWKTCTDPVRIEILSASASNS
jgi:hypothetical protein